VLWRNDKWKGQGLMVYTFVLCGLGVFSVAAVLVWNGFALEGKYPKIKVLQSFVGYFLADNIFLCEELLDGWQCFRNDAL